MQCCLEPLGQDCIDFSAVQCCCMSIKAIMNKLFSYAMLSVASRANFIGFLLVEFCLQLFGQHCTGVIICAILPQGYLLGQHYTVKTLCSVVFEAPENIS